ncbi:hypothetical protein [Psychrobacillus psychrodurans]|uniref:Uncharacterized protein n=1 Tax=Psychrobacillus psychrodurans TaxID=126157 RepID=A0A9X3LE84_9BACI|nr:hypothetical protein [Psychrobacillus psychrodurans]MCZ8535251.1 hypothetical protein [Psychrobacillus psychrodurans]
MESESRVLQATHYGTLAIGEKDLNCAVLEDGSRIISKAAVFSAFGRTQRGRKRGENRVANLPELPSFIDANNLTPYIDGEVRDYLLKPVLYKSKN